MNKIRQFIKSRLQTIFVILVYVTALLIPLLGNTASAYTLQSSRSIKLSSSAQAATNTIYTLAFTTNSGGVSASTAGMVVDICQNDPIIADTCTAPTGFDWVKATLALANQSGITGWSVDTTNSTASKLILTRTTSSVATATAFSIDLGTAANGVTNPNNTNTTFYARVITYDTGAHAQAYTSTNLGSGSIDAGGIALSTTAQITITARVQETLTFCVYTGANCGAGGTSVLLGDTNDVLSPSGPFVDKNTKYDVATNASSGVAIRIKGDTLKSGSFDVAAIGSTAASSSTGAEQFGFCTYQSTGSGLTPASPYNNANCSTTTQTAGTASTGGNGTAQFAFDSANTNTTYGQVYANKVAGASSTGIIAFIGNIATTTEAGSYTTTLTFIATGTY